MLLITVLISCTQVELSTDGEYRKLVPIRTDYDWSVYNPNRPDSMYLLMTNIISGGNYVFAVSMENGKVSKVDSTAELGVPGGEYNVVTCNRNDAMIEITGMDTFMTNKSYPMKSLCLKVCETQYPDFGTYFLTRWTDDNPYYKKLRNTGKIFISSQRTSVQQATPTVLSFVPKPITQHLTLRVKVETVENIAVDSILANLSGVIQRVNISSGVLDESLLGRTFFPLYLKHKSGLTTSVFEGSTDVLGILPGKVNVIYGSGLLSLSVYSADRIDNGAVNVTPQLSKEEPLRDDLDAGGKVKNKDNITIEVEMKYDPDAAAGGGGNSGNNGSIIWISGDDTIIDEET